MSPRHPHLVLAGYYGHHNVGDEAVLVSLLAGLRAVLREPSFTVVSGDPAATAASHGVAAVGENDIAAIAEAVADADVAVLGGGGLLQDYWPAADDVLLTARHGGLPFYLAVPTLASLHGKPTVFAALGVGPLTTEIGRRQARAAVELAISGTVRDQASLDLLAAIGAPPTVELAADPVWALRPAPAVEMDALLSSSGITPGETLLGLSVRPWDFGVEQAAWEAAVAASLDRVLGESPGRVLALPFHGEPENPWGDDLGVLDRVAAQMQHGDRLVRLTPPRAGYPPTVLAGLVARCDRVLAMRYHAVLFALASGVPTVGLAYDPKVASLLADAGLADLALPIASWETGAICRALAAAPAAMAAIDADALLARMQGRAALTYRHVVAALEGRAASESRRGRPAAREFLDATALRKTLAVVRLEEELRASSSLSTRLQADTARRQADTVRQQAELVRVAKERDLQNERLRWFASETVRLQTAFGSLEARHEHLSQDREALGRRLTAVEATLSYRVATQLWRIAGAIAPPGSRRRALYGWLRGRPPAPVGGPASAATSTPTPEAEAAPSPDQAPLDVERDLAAFEALVRDRQATTVVALLCTVRFVESEGQRPTHFARELIRRGIPVIFGYWRWSTNEWCDQDRLEDGLLQLPIDELVDHPDRLARCGASAQRRVLLLEWPYPGFVEVLAAANAAGWETVYDVLDDWEEFHRVGQAIWYDEDVERHLLRNADAVFAINRFLADRMRELGAARVDINPNGLKPGIEVVDQPRPLAPGEVTVGYFGHLTPAWFDWALIAEAARHRPTWRFYLIGYGGDSDVPLPANVVLLGKQAQTALAGFAANWDVAIIPFKPDRLAAGADPIKTYEYLAMGLPVVATGVYPPPGGEAFVIRADGVDDFLAALGAAARDRSTAAAAARRDYAAATTWAARLDAMLGALARGEQAVARKRALLGLPAPCLGEQAAVQGKLS